MEKRASPKEGLTMMLAERRVTGSKKTVAIAVAIFLAGVTALVAARTASATATNNVTGHLTYVVQSPGVNGPCGAGSVLCATGQFTGGIQGSFTNTVTSLVPSAVAGAFYYSGSIAIVTNAGNLSCDLAGALSQTSPDGEFGEICEIKSGTGQYNGATGHLQLIGQSDTSGTPLLGLTGSGDYRGRFFTP
jgi:hypothetical protein